VETFFGSVARSAPGNPAAVRSRPDAHQVAVCWIPLSELAKAPLLPNVGVRLAQLLQQDVPSFTAEA